jgi:hypothetical protein
MLQFILGRAHFPSPPPLLLCVARPSHPPLPLPFSSLLRQGSRRVPPFCSPLDHTTLAKVNHAATFPVTRRRRLSALPVEFTAGSDKS